MIYPVTVEIPWPDDAQDRVLRIVGTYTPGSPGHWNGLTGEGTAPEPDEWSIEIMTAIPATGGRGEVLHEDNWPLAYDDQRIGDAMLDALREDAGGER